MKLTNPFSKLFASAPVSKATQKAKDRPQGVEGFAIASGKITEEFLTELQWPEAGKVYQEMSSNDAVIGGCLYLIETLVRRANWTVVPASQEAGDREAADFLESCMHDMSGQTWDDFISDALSMLTYGFSFHEVIYKVRRGPLEKDAKFRSKYTDGRIGWQKLAIRSQHTLDEWDMNEDTGEILGFKQDPSKVGINGQTVVIPLEGNLLLKTKAAGGNPEGWSLLRRAYRSWFFKRYIEELEGIGIERGLAGIPVLAPPPDYNLFDKDNEQAVKMLAWSQDLVQNLRQDKNHGIVLPNTDWSLKLLGVEGSGKGIDTDKVIRRHEYRMASALLSDLILVGSETTGSYSLAETKQSMLVSSLETIINSIASTINSDLVPQLFAFNNWTLEQYPKITAGDLVQPTASDVALILRSLNVDITKNLSLFNFLLKLIQAPQLSEEEYNLFQEAQAEAQAQEQAPDDEESTGSGEQLQDPVDNAGKQSDKLTR